MSLAVVLIALLCVVFAVWSWVKPRYPLPPVLPGGLPVIGHAHLILGDRTHIWNFMKMINNCSLEKGGLVIFWIGSYPIYNEFKPLLDRLLHLADKQNAFTDDEIREQLDTFTVATYDTTSSALTYTLLWIGTYQDVQKRILEELTEVLGEEDRDVTKDDLPKVVYLEAVLKESLRLYPPGSVIGRLAETDVKLSMF